MAASLRHRLSDTVKGTLRPCAGGQPAGDIWRRCPERARETPGATRTPGPPNAPAPSECAGAARTRLHRTDKRQVVGEQHFVKLEQVVDTALYEEANDHVELAALRQREPRASK